MRKAELLAPAGNYESFAGAIHAGADAVYLGGAKFGARAYAENFTEEEVCRAIRYAHVYGRKVYLTLNTLVKEREFHEIYSYLLPFCRAGLDGVILQDIGAFRAVGRWFPELSRHVSTQMAITGVPGALLLKELGAERIVPARELSLEEIREMKEKAGIEIETFIHGAVCYCYSGQCLFSSLIGGRSGNRGRCAQPCRLPYRMEGGKEECYPLSLKDMCTLEILPELIEAGIDSFKIEGRMKSPEYAAGVTAIYRKYLDRYYREPSAEYQVEKEDMDNLRALYIRSGISTGYYHRHNGRQMVTLESPAYAGRDDALAARIREKYLEGDFRLPVEAKAVLEKGCAARLSLRYGGQEATATGVTVQEAQKRPLCGEDVRKQLAKSGNTAFRMEKMEIEMSGDVFLPVKALNDLRREACEKLEEEIRKANFTAGKGGGHGEERGSSETGEAAKAAREPGSRAGNRKKAVQEVISLQKKETPERKNNIHISVLTREQGMAAALAKAQRVYLPSDLCFEGTWFSELKARCGEGTELYLSLPYIIRSRDREYLKKTAALLQDGVIKGALVRNMEGLHWLSQNFGKEWGKEAVTDAGLYIWNAEAAAFFREYGTVHYLPYELNAYEIQDLTEKTPDAEWAMTVYGRLPMMVSANCILQTGTGCRSNRKSPRPAFTCLTDRYRKKFPVYADCIHCCNIVYNSLPLSLHRNMGKLEKMGIRTFRLDFTLENGRETDRVIRYFTELAGGGGEQQPPYGEYTNGHWKRGVE